MSELSDADISGLNALGHALRLFKEIAPNIPGVGRRGVRHDCLP